MRMKRIRKTALVMAFMVWLLPMCNGAVALAAEPEQEVAGRTGSSQYAEYGGGYAATGQLPGVGYTTELYDCTNGLPTSDAMFLLGAEDGHLWIGGYSGVLRYDGTAFERMDTSEGLTSARGMYGDREGRIWVGTNDNGVVVIDGKDRFHLTYKDGLPSSSIRTFAEDGEGRVFIGTTAGICYVDSERKVHEVPGIDVSEERVLRMDMDVSGIIYGQTSGGSVFAIEDCRVTALYTSKELGIEKITTIMADPEQPGMLYFGTEGNNAYYGHFGDKAAQLERISLGGMKGVHWINYDCGRIWVSSTSQVGYLSENRDFHILEKLPMDSGIEMLISDYQGNLWAASSTQGVMKLVTNNFVDVTGEAGLPGEVANCTCLYGDELYIGTEKGVLILGADGKAVSNELTEYIGASRIRCIQEDTGGKLWIGTYTNDVGLICYSKKEGVKAFTTKNGLLSNQVRAITIGKDGSILVGTNGGLAVIQDGKVVRTAGSKEGISNTVILTLVETEDDRIMLGTDGGGIYVIGDGTVEKLSRDDGLTSDVIMRLLPDEQHGVYWIVTSNSIEYVKEGEIKQVTSFPYNNNYDMYFDHNGRAWILSSYGLYNVNTEEMLRDGITDYKLYTVENGLPYSITANSFSARDEEGNLYMPGRNGVIRVNIEHYFEGSGSLLTAVNAIYCDDERIYPDEEGGYQIPVGGKRIQILPAVMDYSLLNPMVRVYLEGGPDNGITVEQSKLSSLEYTNLSYGEYKLHIQVLNRSTGEILQDSTFRISKKARLGELPIVRVMLLLLLALATGYLVWKIMRSTIIARQMEEIRRVKEEAQRAETAKTRFFANLSHELRTPINTIMGVNEMAMREDATGVPQGYFMDMANYAFDVRDASEELLGLINDLLDIARIESGRMSLVEREYDMQTMLRSIVSMARARSAEKDLSFEVEVDEILPRKLYGDAGKIRQIVLNLLLNAVKYTDVGGIVLSVSMDERKGEMATLSFSVKDTGMGIREEEREKLLHAYERLEEASGGIEATSIGLDISRRFAELMNGELQCESTYGEGSRFLLRITQKIMDETPLGEFTEHTEEEARGKYVPMFVAPDADILVIDDNSKDIEMIKAFLRGTKVFVTTARTGVDALDKIKDTHFDVIFMDQAVSGMDGFETMEKIRELDPKLPVYALTSNVEDDGALYKDEGFSGYLMKPLNGVVLEKTILQHLPERIMEKAARKEAESGELPEAMCWLGEIKELSVSDGLKNTGGASGYLFALNLFRDTIDDNIRIIREAYEDGNVRLYATKARVLKRSAHIIGAGELEKQAERLVEAIERQDLPYIKENAEKLLAEYETYKEKLSRLKN